MSESVFCDDGREEMAEVFWKGSDKTLCLFTNDITPARSDSYADYTVASGSGYADKTLTGSSFSISTVSNETIITYAQQSWTFTGDAGTIYGYIIVTTDATPILLQAQRFDIPQPTSNGKIIKVTPRIVDKSEYPLS